MATSDELMRRYLRMEASRKIIGWSQIMVCERLNCSMSQLSKAKTGRFELLLSDLEWLDTLAALHTANPRPVPGNRTMISEIGPIDGHGGLSVSAEKIVQDMVDMRRQAHREAANTTELGGALWAIRELAKRLGLADEYAVATVADDANGPMTAPDAGQLARFG